jgi:hypothetical protein
MRALSLGAVAAIGVGALLLVGLTRSARTSTSIGPVERSADIQPGDRGQPPEMLKADRTDPQTLTYAGRYRLAGPQSVLDVTGETLIVTGADGRLFVESKQGKSEMLPESEGTFRVPQYSSTVTFVRDEKGQVKRMIVNLMGWKELAATRIE